VNAPEVLPTGGFLSCFGKEIGRGKEQGISTFMEKKKG
jgi:hypothetical protein